MISPDVNVLVYAFRQDSVKHEECRDWLNEQIRNRNGLVLIDVVLVGFLRICTDPKISGTKFNLRTHEFFKRDDQQPKCEINIINSRILANILPNP